MHERRYRKGALYMECAGSLIHQEEGHGVGFHPGSHADDPGEGLSEDRHRGRLNGRYPALLNDRSERHRVHGVLGSAREVVADTYEAEPRGPVRCHLPYARVRGVSDEFH